MLAIRMQRRGRKGHAQFRVVVQDSHLSPKSGRVIANLGNYNPHTKQATIDKEAAAKYLSNGAQPSDRVVSVFKAEKIKLPDWVSVTKNPKRETRNPEKLRKNQPAQESKDEPKPTEAPAAEEAPVEEPTPEVAAEETPATEEATPSEEVSNEEAPAEEPVAEEAEAPVEEKPAA